MLDLQPFCGREEDRFYLMKPFSRDGFTYATDGIIMVRVTLRPDVPDVDKKFNQEGPLKALEAATFFRPSFVLPPEPTTKGNCTACEGRGYDHDCPDCECVCETCDGEGDMDIERRISTTIGPKIYRLYYVRMMLSLPGIEIATLPDETDEKPLLFRFDDGVGALMPMRSEYSSHISINLDKAA